MSALFGGGGTVGEKSPKYSGMQVQTSSSVATVPLIYGMNQAAMNLIWYGDFRAIKHKEKQGGKGGGGVTQVSYTYSASFAACLCEGEIADVARVWVDNIQGGSGNKAITPWDFKSSQVDPGNDWVQVAKQVGDALATGQGPYQLTVSGGGSLPGGLSPATDYWINVTRVSLVGGLGLLGAYRVKFAASQDDAASGPFIDITSAGSGTISATPGAQTETIESLGFTLFTGPTPQTPWGYLTTNHPDEALGYNGTAYLAAANYDLGSSASLPNHRFEVCGLLWYTGVGGTVPDADPALMADDFLTNPRYGAGFPEDMVDDDQLYSGPNAETTGDSAYQTYCRALGLAISPVLTDSETAAEVLERWLKITNSEPVWTGTSLKLIPRGDENITANGVTFLANVTPVYNLTTDDFIADKGEPPILIDRQSQDDTYNQLRVECRNRADAYNLKPVEAKDQASIEQFGLRPDSDFKAHEICDIDMAQMVAYLINQRAVYIRSTFRFKLDANKFIRLEPMDVVSLTNPKQYLDQFRVRIREVEEGDDNVLDIMAEEMPIGVATPGFYYSQPSEGGSTNAFADPGDVNDPIIFEPPASLLQSRNIQVPQVWISVSGAAEFWGGANVWASTDNATFTQIGTLGVAGRNGELLAMLASYGGSNPDTMNTLEVTIAQSGGQLESTDPVNAEAGVTLCYVDGELLSYTNATLTGPGEYDLDDLYRGLYGTTAGSHAAGTAFARVDDTLFQFDLPIEYVGQTIYLKFTSFNSFGQVEQSLADVSAYSYVPTGAAFDQLGTATNFQTPMTGFNITHPGGILYLTPAGTLASGTIVMPASPLNNQQVQVYTTEEVTALTVSPNSGQMITGQPTTLLANTSFTMVYRSSDTTWYRL